MQPGVRSGIRGEKAGTVKTLAPKGPGFGAAVMLCLAVAMTVALPARLAAAPYAAMVIDARSGEVLHARNHDTRLHPASLTKMMTLYIAFEALARGEITLDTPVTISAKAAGEPCSCLGLRAGQTIALRYLIRAAAVRSSNDAATAIGEAISGSEAAFIARMNRTARAMGMNDTTFRNAHGLTAQGHLSTARDMTTLGRQLFFDYPQYYNLFSRRSADAGIAQVVNTNRRFLDAYRGADGIKTGFTRAAGFNLTASAERDGRRIIATVFGGASVADRNARMTELLDMGFARAPAQVALRRPAPPAYTGPDQRAPAADAGGRTIRVQTAPARSPIPPARPLPEATVPDELLLAVQAGVGNVLAALAEDSAEPAPPAARPMERPEGLAEAIVPPAETTDDTVQKGDATPGSPGRDMAQAAVEPRDQPQMSEATPGPSGAVATRGTAVSGIVLTSAMPPPRPAEGIVQTSTTAEPPQPGVPNEVLTRQVSTSEPRMWGINIGRYSSAFDAERVLMQTALADITALDGAVRKVRPVSGGFDAQFLGMTREQADLACRRLQARDRLCFTLAP